MWHIVWLVIVGLALAGSASAGGLAPSKGSELVELNALPTSATCPSGGKAFDVVNNPDGTTSSFVVPPNKILVVADVSMLVGAYTSAAAQTEFLLQRETASSSNVISDIAVPGSLNNLAYGGTSTGYLTFPTGVRIKAGVQLCIKTNITGNITGNTGTFIRATAHGFLAPDK